MAAKRAKFDDDKPATATAEPPALANFVITFRQNAVVPNGSVVMEGCVDADEARRKLHEFIDQTIVQIEKSKR